MHVYRWEGSPVGAVFVSLLSLSTPPIGGGSSCYFDTFSSMANSVGQDVAVNF